MRHLTPLLLILTLSCSCAPRAGTDPSWLITRDYPPSPVDVVLSTEVTEELLGRYAPDSTFVEWGACLYGFERNDTTFLTRWEEPEVIASGSNFLVKAPCARDALAILHAHPRASDSCWHSRADLIHLKNYVSFAGFPVAVSLLICEDDGTGPRIQVVTLRDLSRYENEKGPLPIYSREDMIRLTRQRFNYDLVKRRRLP